MTSITQLVLATLATVAAIASAIAAWQARATAKESLKFQKTISRHQDSLFLLRSTIEYLWQLKRIIDAPLAVDDHEFESLDEIHRRVRLNLESLARSGVIQSSESTFFAAHSRAEIIDQIPNGTREIEVEIKRLEARISEIFS